MNMLEITTSYMIFEMSVNGIDAEVRVNCEVDENHFEGQDYGTLMLDCPGMEMSELNAKRFVRDFKILELMAVKAYEDKYAPVKYQTEDSFLDN